MIANSEYLPLSIPSCEKIAIYGKIGSQMRSGGDEARGLAEQMRMDCRDCTRLKLLYDA
jgi:hypothetical protein